MEESKHTFEEETRKHIRFLQEREKKLEEETTEKYKELDKLRSQVKSLEDYLDINELKVARFSVPNLYREIIRNRFADKQFREGEIRTIANIKWKSKKTKGITPSYGRGIFVKLTKEKFIRRVGKGVYVYNQS